MRHNLLPLAATLLLAVLAQPSPAQAGYEIEVYGAEMALPKSLLLELHSNYTFQGQQLSQSGSQPPVVDDAWRSAFSAAADPVCTGTGVTFFDLHPNAAHGASLAPRNARPNIQGSPAAASGCPTTSGGSASNTTHETLEAATGLTSWAEVGGYVFASKQGSGGVQLVGGSMRVRVRVPASWRWPLDVGLSTEFEHEGAQYSTDTWTWEIRPIIDKTLGRWYVSVNPTLERTLQGAGTANGVQFSPSSKVSYDLNRIISGGVEYYGAFGQLGAFPPPIDRLQQFFGTVDIRASPLWEINFGVGIGTTPATNHLMAKLILGRTFSW